MTDTAANPAAFEFLVPLPKERLTPGEVASCIGRTVWFVRDMIGEGQLVAQVMLERGKKQGRSQVARSSVVRLLALHAHYDPADYLLRISALLKRLDRSGKRAALEMIAYASELHETGTLEREERHDPVVPHAEKKRLLTPSEVAACIGWSTWAVYDLIEEGTLEAHAPFNRELKRYVITRRSVCLTIAEQARHNTPHLFTRLLPVMRALTAEQLARLSADLKGESRL